jgi:hypothetical protein
MKEPYMKQYQLLILALFVVTISLNAMDKKETSAPIETSGKGSNTRTFNAHKAEEITSNSAPAVLVTAAALAELSTSDDEGTQDADTKPTLSDVYKTKAYSHNGSWEGAYYSTKAYGEDSYNCKKLYKQKDREKNSKK